MDSGAIILYKVMDLKCGRRIIIQIYMRAALLTQRKKAEVYGKIQKVRSIMESGRMIVKMARVSITSKIIVCIEDSGETT